MKQRYGLKIEYHDGKRKPTYRWFDTFAEAHRVQGWLCREPAIKNVKRVTR